MSPRKDEGPLYDDDVDISRFVRFPERRLGPMRIIAIRVGIALLALLATTVIVYNEQACYQDRGEIDGLSWIDAFYYATVSLSTTGYGDITPVCESARLVNALVITPLRFLFLIVLVGTTIEVLTRRTRDQIRTRRWRSKVKDHTLIIGYGVKGRAAAQGLVDAGVPKSQIVVVANERAAVDSAARDGLVGIIGDGRREEVLMDAGVERAASIVVATDEDDTTILITLTARRLAPMAKIVAAAREAQNADIIRQSGANNVIPTAESAGRLMSLSLMSSAAGELMEDLLDSGRGLEVAERDITLDELGLSPAELDANGQIVLAVVRKDTAHRFDTDSIGRLEAGDRLVVIRQNSTGR
ncbi:MAG: NAD-binding protein [Actinomycetes bacterium]